MARRPRTSPTAPVEGTYLPAVDAPNAMERTFAAAVELAVGGEEDMLAYVEMVKRKDPKLFAEFMRDCINIRKREAEAAAGPQAHVRRVLTAVPRTGLAAAPPGTDGG